MQHLSKELMLLILAKAEYAAVAFGVTSGTAEMKKNSI
jgi:hypothetical protein